MHPMNLDPVANQTDWWVSDLLNARTTAELTSLYAGAASAASLLHIDPDPEMSWRLANAFRARDDELFDMRVPAPAAGEVPA